MHTILASPNSYNSHNERFRRSLPNPSRKKPPQVGGLGRPRLPGPFYSQQVLRSLPGGPIFPHHN
jgi:hypothetical protein